MPVDLDTWSLKIQKPVMLNYKTRQKAEVANTELDKLLGGHPIRKLTSSPRVEIARTGSGKKNPVLTGVTGSYEHIASRSVNRKAFSIGKGGVIARAVVKFAVYPAPRPNTVCFHFAGNSLTHRVVLNVVRERLDSISGAKVVSVQVIDRNVIHASRWLENRWLITVNSAAARFRLLRGCLRMLNKTVNVRAYDDVVTEEYHEYQAYLDALKRMNMKVKDFGASSALLPPRMRIPSRTTSPVGSGRLSSARRQLSGTARTPVSVVEDESHMEAIAAKITARQLSERESGETKPASLRGDGGAAASAVGDVTRTAGMSEVDAIVFELRTKHAEKLEENLRSIGVLRPDRSRVLQAQSTQSVASLDEQKSLAVGTGTCGVTQSADSIKVIASTARGLRERQGGYRNDATAQTKAGLVPENVIGYGVDSPTDSEANKGRSSASTHSGARWRHLKPLYVEGHTQTPPAPPPTATEADVQTSARSGDTTMSADSVPRDGATVVKWDKMSNSSDYDADDDDDDVCDELGVLPATPRTAVSQWAQKEQTKAEQEVDEDQTKVEQEVSEEQNEIKPEVDDEQNEAEQEVTEEQNETEPEVEKERSETEQEIEEGPNEEQVEEEQNEMEPKVERKRNEEEVEEQEEEQNETEPEVENEEEQDQEKPASTPESFVYSATIDSFANVRNYLMTYVPEIRTQIPEMTEEPSDAKEPALPSMRQLQHGEYRGHGRARRRPDGIELPPLSELDLQRASSSSTEDDAERRWQRRRRRRGDQHVDDPAAGAPDDVRLIKRLASDVLQRNRRVPTARSIATMSLPPLDFDDAGGERGESGSLPRRPATCKAVQVDRLTQLPP